MVRTHNNSKAEADHSMDPNATDVPGRSPLPPNSSQFHDAIQKVTEDVDRAIKTINKVHKELGAINKSARKLQNKYYSFMRREQLHNYARRKVMTSLKTAEELLLGSFPRLLSSMERNEHKKERVGQPLKRQAAEFLFDRPTALTGVPDTENSSNDQPMSAGGPAPLTALSTAPTLIEPCPPEHQLPSESLPRPPEPTPKPSPSMAPASTPWPGGLPQNDTQIPPEGARRAARSCNPSPSLTLARSAATPDTPAPVRLRKPLNNSPSKPPATPIDYIQARRPRVERPRALSPLVPNAASKVGVTRSSPIQFRRGHYKALSIGSMLNKSPKPHRSSVERTHSPFIETHRNPLTFGEQSSAYPDHSIPGPEQPASEGAMSPAAESERGKPTFNSDGPATRTRARVNGAGALTNKRKRRN